MLRAEVARLRKRAARLTALLRVLFAVLRACRVDLARGRVPDGDDKRSLVRAVTCASALIPLRQVLRPLGLSPSRFHSWRRSERECEFDDQSSCPKTTPQSLTANELRTIHDLVTSPEYRHVPTGTLAVLAQRLGRVFASPSTWRRLVRVNGWRRPRLRVHPAKPKLGIRASAADEMWHIDTTVIRLVNGSRAYLHAVIDNFSRRILAWRVTERFDTGSTATVLLDAACARETAGTPTVMVDGGVENCNGEVDALIDSGLLRRVIAMTELVFSNSMIEACGGA